MFELEALLLGLEPLTAAAIGVGALALAPLVGAIDSMTGHQLGENTRNAAKTGLVWSFDAFDKVQSSFAEASESFQDLVAEAKAEKSNSKNSSSEVVPHEVTVG
jgi:hypothetical protein